MTPGDFEVLSSLLKRRSGLFLGEDKTYLLESRLIPVARKRGMSGIEELAAAIRKNRDEALLADVTEAMTTNESSFFRDIKPFENFRDLVLPRMLESREMKRSFRIWCAACSTGQEPYSLAICLREEAEKLAGWRVEIIATDLSTDVLEKAKVGMYSQFEVQRGMPIQLLMKYFDQIDEMWQIDSSLRAMVKFRPLNLLDDFSSLGPFDVIYCRNVLIYFDNATKKSVLERMNRIMPRDGYLFLGGAETVLGVTDAFHPVANHRGVYELVPETSH